MQRSSIEDVFKDRPASLVLFEIVRKYIESIGAVTTSATKTQIAFKTRRQFAWVWMPQMWIKQAPEDGIVVSFRLGHRAKDERIKESLEPYPGRFMHHVVLEKSSQFDAKLKSWLREAHAFSQQAR